MAEVIWCQISIREPMITVRSSGRLKYAAALAVMYDVAMNRRLRQGDMVASAPAVNSIFDKK
ncbi:hypothetical protein LAUMK13_05361 [Mycobacterium innocens]|uniref:Uncharacterized protein n=1 Tax=Mycobacterium innocens TaxID=2341083 RepID=A0A498QGX5_9MYCO|nr:hypothetical protein LAUMK13_05361 [Mycobacterium innocens]